MSIEKRWHQFQSRYDLTDHQIDQFKRYLDLLVAWNKRMNLTAITKPEDIISFHFDDSLRIGQTVNMNAINSIADIGTGAGFPGIPLKIKYPDIALYLIEVNQKKVGFLEAVVKELGLEKVEIYLEDWRTFLRHTQGEIDLFCARASLQPKELIRMFKPSSPYNESMLAYWASGTWQPERDLQPFIEEEYPYGIQSKNRKIVLLKNS